MSLWNDSGGDKFEESDEMQWLNKQPDFVNDTSEESSFPWGWILLIGLAAIMFFV